MCTPVAAIGFGLQAVSQVASFAGQQQQTDAYNAAAAQNAQNASLAAERQYEDQGRRFIYNNTKVLQEGQDAIFSARKARGALTASAGSAGIDASSLTVQSLLSESHSEEARSEYNADLKRQDSLNALKSANDEAYAQAQGRIASMPHKDGPSPLALGLGIATAGLDATKSTQLGKNWMGVQ